jgi:hypothetical protein
MRKSEQISRFEDALKKIENDPEFFISIINTIMPALAEKYRGSLYASDVWVAMESMKELCMAIEMLPEGYLSDLAKLNSLQL